MAFHAETITVQRTTTGAPDADGVPTSTTTPEQVDGCTVQPTGTRESVGQNDIVTSRWLVSTTEPQDWITADDTVIWRGETFDIDGRPQTYRSVLPHTEFVITETKG
jgi:hypothetical protein